MLTFLQEADARPRITVREAIFLAVVADDPGRSTGALAQQVGVSRQVSTRTTTALVTRGFMSKRTDAKNRKLVQVTLTKRGAARLEKLRASYGAA